MSWSARGSGSRLVRASSQTSCSGCGRSGSRGTERSVGILDHVMLPRYPGRPRTRIRLARRGIAVMALALGLIGASGAAAADGDHISRLRLTGTIDQVNASFVTEALRSAADGGAAAVIVEVDTPGCALDSMDAIVTAILNSPIPVITYVAPDGARAGSAGTFVVLAGDVAAMAPSTEIGAASVVGSGGAELPPTLA